jgi:chemotaxis protein MotB
MLKRRRHESTEIWPGFIDSLAILLMVIVFVLMIFIVAQLYLSDELSGRNRDLALLKMQIESLEKMSSEKDSMTKKALIDLEKLRKLLAQAQLTAELLTKDKQILLDEKKILETTKLSLEEQLKNYLKNINNLKFSLKMIEDKSKKDTLDLENLKKEALSFEDLKKIFAFRSEFLEKLKAALGNRKDFRVVGDRFVFHSEVLFAAGSAQLDHEGQERLDYLVKALEEISQKIPETIPWVLRVDGHTDFTPIKTQQFPSNWELSTARAVSVVKYMISKGIHPKRLVAAGFGEFQPLITTKNTKDLTKNRRIEFKLDIVTVLKND